MKGLLYLVILLFMLFISWGATVGIIYLITLCFNLHFSIVTATGIWLLMFLIKSLFNNK